MSTFGYMFMLGGGAIRWKSVKQDCTAKLEAEYVAACEATKEVLWFKRFSFGTWGGTIEAITTHSLL